MYVDLGATPTDPQSMSLDEKKKFDSTVRLVLLAGVALGLHWYTRKKK